MSLPDAVNSSYNCCQSKSDIDAESSLTVHQDQNESGVIISPITAIQTISLIFVAVGCGVIVSTQPVLLAAMLQENRLTTAQLGHAATVELLGMAAMTAIAGARFKLKRLRRTAVIAVLMSILANILTMASSGNFIVTARLLSGCGSGVLLWLFISMVVRSGSPARLNGIYSATMSGIALCLSIFCSQWLVPHLGANGAFGGLLILNILMLGPAWLVPNQFSALPQTYYKRFLPDKFGLISLVSAGAYMGAITSLWVYIIPLSAELGQPKAYVNLAVSLGIACQIVGGVIAATLGHRISYVFVISGCTILALAVLASLNADNGIVLYIVGLSIFGMIWTFAPSYHVMLTIAADPSRRSAVFIVTAQMLGVAAGPFLSSLVVSTHSVHSAIAVSAGLFGLSLILFFVVLINIIANRNPRLRAAKTAQRPPSTI